MSDYITPEARKLLQRLNARGAVLQYDKQEERFTFVDQGCREMLLGRKQAAAKEVLHLCAVQTVVKLPPIFTYELSDEGRRILLRPGYVPVIIAGAKPQPHPPVAGTR